MRFLLISDTHGKLAFIDALAAQVGAEAVIHAGDFGFFDEGSTVRLSDRELTLKVVHSELPKLEKDRILGLSRDGMIEDCDMMQERIRGKPMSRINEKIEWSGRIVAAQPRIRLMRSFDQRSHSYLGYVLRVEGTVGYEPGEFIIAIGEAAHKKHQFHVGMEASALSVPVPDARLETAVFYKTSGITILKDVEDAPPADPPFHGVPPDLDTYRSRGHRRLDTRTYETKCSTCIWGCRMPVEMILDHWNPSKKRYRFETFCYGPKSCSLYRAGPPRKVPGRKGMSYTEEDWVDEDATSHRGPDD